MRSLLPKAFLSPALFALLVIPSLGGSCTLPPLPPDATCELLDAGACARWLVRHELTELDEDAFDLAVSPDGQALYVLGSTGLLAYSTGGKLAWAADGDFLGQGHRSAVVVSHDSSRVYVAATVQAGVANDIRTLAYDASSGELLWSRDFNGPGNGTDLAAGIAADPHGDAVFVAGDAWTGDGQRRQDMVTIAYSASTGETLWTAFYDDARASDGAAGIGIHPSGSTVYVAGSTWEGWQVALAYDASTGKPRWQTKHDNPGTWVPEDAALDPEGKRFFITGTLWGAKNPDFKTFAYDTSNGQLLWARIWDGPDGRADELALLAVSPDGRLVAVSGASQTEDNGYDFATIAYASDTGAELWTTFYDGPMNFTDAPTASVVTGEHVIVTGLSQGLPPDIDGNYDYATVWHDLTSGELAAVRRYNGLANGDDRPASIGVHPRDGTVYVTGTSSLVETHVVGVGDGWGSLGVDYATLAYDPIPITSSAGTRAAPCA